MPLVETIYPHCEHLCPVAYISARQRSACRGLYALDVAHDPSRIQGGNWKMQGFRRSGHLYDEAECQISIAEFMADMQEFFDIGE
jgi:hypothetical protein